MMIVKRYAAALAATVTLMTLGLSGPATAGTTDATATFTTQSRAAGLSGADAQALQKKVDRYLQRHSGRQVSPNEIDLANGARLTVTVPGEKVVREFRGATAPRAAVQWECDHGYFCMFRQTLGMGDRIALYYCQDYALQGWTGYGSYYNNQTRGTQALLKNQNRTVVDVTPAAPFSHASYDWTPIWFVRPC